MPIRSERPNMPGTEPPAVSREAAGAQGVAYRAIALPGMRGSCTAINPLSSIPMA